MVVPSSSHTTSITMNLPQIPEDKGKAQVLLGSWGVSPLSFLPCIRQVWELL